jgi:hypothetical protein
LKLPGRGQGSARLYRGRCRSTGAIIDRIRDHIKKAPPRKDRFDLNEAINEQTKIDLKNVSTYKAAPGRAGQQRVRKKDLTRGGLGDRELRGNMMDRYLCFEGNKLLRFYTRKERREQHRQ